MPSQHTPSGQHFSNQRTPLPQWVRSSEPGKPKGPVRHHRFRQRSRFGGEESAGASFLRHNGTVWSTDKDCIILSLLAAEITARTGKTLASTTRKMTVELGTPFYTPSTLSPRPSRRTCLRNSRPKPSQPQNSQANRSRQNSHVRREMMRRWRTESRLDKRLVCRASFRDGKHLQTLRREPEER